MVKCLRCGAGNEWIEGTVKNKSEDEIKKEAREEFAEKVKNIPQQKGYVGHYDYEWENHIDNLLKEYEEGFIPSD